MIHLLFPVHLPCIINNFTVLSHPLSVKPLQAEEPSGSLCSCRTCPSFSPSVILVLLVLLYPLAVERLKPCRAWREQYHGIAALLGCLPFLSYYYISRHISAEIIFLRKIIHTASGIFSSSDNIQFRSYACELEAWVIFFSLHCIYQHE